MTTTKSIEQIQQEVDQAQQKAREAEQALKVAKEEALKVERENAEKLAEAKRKEEHEVFQDKWMPVAEKIAAELRKAGFAKAIATRMEYTGHSRSYPAIYPHGERTYGKLNIQFADVYGGSTYRRYICGTRIQVSKSYSDKKIYPQRKDGTFNIEKIVETASQYHSSLIAQEAAKKRTLDAQASNKERMVRLTDEFGVLPYEGASYKQLDNVSIFDYETFHNYGKGTEYRHRSDNDLILKIQHISEADAAAVLKFMAEHNIGSDKE